MTRAERESTARIKREELVGLLDTMHPAEQQPITARVRISDIEAAAAREEPAKLAKGTGERKAIKTTKRKVKAVEVAKVAEAVAKVTEPLKCVETVPTGPVRAVPQVDDDEAIEAAAARVIEAAQGVITARFGTEDAVVAKPVEKTAEPSLPNIVEQLKTVEAAKALEAAKAVEDAKAEAMKVVEALSAIEATKSAEPQRLFKDVDWDNILGAAVSAMVNPLVKTVAPPPVPERAKRPSKAPFSHIAALLPSTPVPRRAKTNSGITSARTSSEHKAVQVIADVRAKLESAEAASKWDAQAERAVFPTLSPQVAAQLTGEEISMLPMEIRLLLPEVSPLQFPRIAMTPVPSDLAIGIRSMPCKKLGHSISVEEPVAAPVEAAPEVAERSSWSTVWLMTYFLIACLGGFGAVYWLTMA